MAAPCSSVGTVKLISKLVFFASMNLSDSMEAGRGSLLVVEFPATMLRVAKVAILRPGPVENVARI